MAKYTVTAPSKGYNGQRAGVAFTNGVATGVDDSDERQARALAYFRRRGYKVESERSAKAAKARTPSPADPPPATDAGEKPAAEGPGEPPADPPTKPEG